MDIFDLSALVIQVVYSQYLLSHVMHMENTALLFDPDDIARTLSSEP